MSDEAIIKDRPARAFNFTVNQANSLEKGSILKMTDNSVAILNSGQIDIKAGNNGIEKLQGEGRR